MRRCLIAALRIGRQRFTAETGPPRDTTALITSVLDVRHMFKQLTPIVRRAAGRKSATEFLCSVLVSLPVTLGGCAEIGRFSAQDASRAGSIAAAVGDSAGVACWPVIQATANAVAATGDHPGILVTIEESRAAKMALANPVCQPIWAGVLADLLKIAPPTSLVP
jgi:hypothetical protein